MFRWILTSGNFLLSERKGSILSLLTMLREMRETCRRLMAGRADFVFSRPKARRPRTTVKLELEGLTERILPAVNVYTWDPQPGSTSASAPQNWLLNGNAQGANGSVPGVQVTDQVVLRGDVSNSNITWDKQLFKFASISLGVLNDDGTPKAASAYTGQQIIPANDAVELTGDSTGTSLTPVVPTSYLSLNFGNQAIFKTDGSATITNMGLSGAQNGQFQLGGNSSIGSLAANGQYVDNIGTLLGILPGGNLSDYGWNPLTFTNSGVGIQDQGQITMFYSSAPGTTLVKQNQFIDGCSIYVDGGNLIYQAQPGVTDTIAVPIRVDNGGTFAVTAFNTQNPGGTLIVQGAVASTHNASVYLTGNNSSVQLSAGTTLRCDNDYYQDNGTLETMDPSTCTLQDGKTGAGTANIVGGNLMINPLSLGNPAGQLAVNCGTLNFAGTYYAQIDADYPGLGDLLKVNGTMTIQNTASLELQVFGTLEAGSEWDIIAANNQMQPFNNTNEAEYDLHEGVTNFYLLSY